MNSNPPVEWDDTILPFQLDRADIRGRAARLDTCLGAILGQHGYPPEIEALVGEAVLLTALIGQTIKLRWKLSLQIRGDGPARLIATDYYAPDEEGAPARIRGWASFDENRLVSGVDPFSQIGNGYFAVLIDQGEGSTPYSGMTPIAGISLADCAAAYFAQSEQLPTRFALSVGRSILPGQKEGWRAGGVMLQHMPKASPLMQGNMRSGLSEGGDFSQVEAAENWNRTGHLLSSVEEFELIGPTIAPTEMLYRLFHEEEPRIFDPQKVEFGCPCSRERVIASLSIYSDKDIAYMTTDEGVVTADCQFCGTHYRLDPAELGFEAKQRSTESADE